MKYPNRVFVGEKYRLPILQFGCEVKNGYLYFKDKSVLEKLKIGTKNIESKEYVNQALIDRERSETANKIKVLEEKNAVMGMKLDEVSNRFEDFLEKSENANIKLLDWVKEQDRYNKTFRSVGDDLIETVSSLSESFTESISQLEQLFSDKSDDLLSWVESIDEKLQKSERNFDIRLEQLEQGQHLNIREHRRISKKVEETDSNVNIGLKAQKKLEVKFSSLMELFAEKMAEHEILPDFFSKDFKMRDVLKNSCNPQTKVLLAMLYLMKKQLTDKGIRIA